MNPNAAAGSRVAPLGPKTIVVLGGVASTCQIRSAGPASTLPKASVARTRKACGPSGRLLSATGLEQPANAAPSRLHSNPAASSAPKSNVAALVLTRPTGPDVIAL